MSYEAWLAFDTDDPQFARGFEAGRIYEAFRNGEVDALDGQPFHASNVEMVLRMAERYEVAVSADIEDDGGVDDAARREHPAALSP